MLWKPINILIDEIKPPEGYALGQLTRAEVPELVSKIRAWFPQAAVSGERCHMTADFYFLKTLLAGETEDRRILPVVVRRDGAIVSLTTLEKDRDDLSITARMGVVDPAHRGVGLGKLGPRLVECMGRAIGAELAYYFATMRIPHEQVISEAQGFRLVGILPASDRERMPDGSVKRVPEAMYVKLLSGEYEVPPAGALTETTSRLWRYLFG